MHEIADFALTRFYEPADDIGLGAEWLGISDRLMATARSGTAALGFPVGQAEHLFDPGRLGSYFQSEADVARHLEQVTALNDSMFAPLVRVLSRRAR